MEIAIRAAGVDDLPAINAIYNHYVLESTCTYQLEPSTSDERRQWFEQHGPMHPIIVAVHDERVIGWGSLSRFHPRAAYDRTVENSLYVHNAWQRRGVGRALLTELISRARELGHHTIIAGISAEQTASIELHRAFGFQQAGHLRRVGHKFGHWLDVIYMQYLLT